MLFEKAVALWNVEEYALFVFIDVRILQYCIIHPLAGIIVKATIYAVAHHLGMEVHEWRTPTPTIWQEHVHNSSSGTHSVSRQFYQSCKS